MPARIHRRPSRAPSRTLAQRHAQRRALFLEPLEARQLLALVAVFDNPSFVDTFGGSSSESDTIQASLTSLGHTVTTFTSTTAAGIAAALAGKDAVVFPEFENGDPLPAFDAAARTQLASFVSGGGGLIAASAYSTTAGFLNAVFGFSLVNTANASPYALSASANDTAFSGGPGSLPDNNATRALATASLPPGSRAIYINGGASAVSWMPYGAGAVVNLGWDWYDAAPLGSQDGGWIDVLGRSVDSFERIFQSTLVVADPGGSSGPYNLATADFDNDGDLDVVSANISGRRAGVYLNDGTGASYATSSPGVDPSGFGYYNVATADFNGDGNADFAATTFSGFRLWFGNGAGGFTAGDHIASNAYPIATGDFNEDGKPDIVVATNGTGPGVQLFLGNGLGGFSASGVLPSSAGYPFHDLKVGDVNGDGFDDVLGSTMYANGLYVALGNGTGGFTFSGHFVAGAAGSRHLALGDLNADGKLDVVTANRDSSSVSVFLGNGLGSFTVSTTVTTAGAGPYSAGVADFDGDGDQDIVAINTDNKVVVLLGDGSGTTFTAPTAKTTFPAGNGAIGTDIWTHDLVVGDFDGNGSPDVAAANHNQGTVGFLLNRRSSNSRPVFTSPSEFSVPENSTAVGTVVATDSDLPAQTVTYAITGGADAGKFTLSSGGVLTFNSPPNFESPTDAAPTDNVYQLEVTASDGAGGNTVQAIAVTVTNVAYELAISRVLNAIEGYQLGQFVVSIPVASASDLVVSYSVSGSATSGADYTPLSGTVTIFAGQLSNVINVSPGADDLVEATEDVVVTLTSANNPDYVPGTETSAASLNIASADAAVFTIADASVNEADGTLTLTITSSKKIDLPVSVHVRYVGSGPNAADGDGVDYDSATDTSTFPAETLTRTVTVVITNDLLSEGTETLIARLELADGDYGDRSLTAEDTADVEIVDNDVDLRVTGSGSPQPVVLAGSGPGNLTYELTVTNAGLTTATNVDLSTALTLPAGVTIDSITPEAGSFTPVSPIAGTLTVASLAPSASLKLTVVLTVGNTAADGATVSGFALAVSANEVLVATEDDSASVATTVQALDFGDAPTSYSTLLAAGGPRHRLGLGPKLGLTADPEADGQPTATAQGDDAAGDDEDGVLLPGGLVPGLAAQVQVTASAAAKLDAWVDFNRNGAFEAGEQVFTSQTVAAGANLLSFAVPAAASSGATYARFRLSTAGGLGPTGLAADGEVEDYAIAIGSCTPGSAVLVSDPLELGGVALLVCGTANSDAISIKPAATAGVTSVTISPFPTPAISLHGAYTRIIVQARGGNDSIAIDARLTVPTLLYGEAGNDTISGGSGPDVIYGGEGTDSLAGNAGDDQLFGEAGADRLYGGAGNDAFTESGAGAFVLSASQLTIAGVSHTLSGLERAVLQGSAGADSFNVGAWPGTGAIDGLGGTDKLLAAGNVNFTLTNALLTRSVGGAFTLASIEEAELTGGTGNNTLDASSFVGRLKLDGGSGNDLLKSGAGPALLLGGVGNDQLQGGGGRTVQIGGAGVDTLLGGGGDDLLVSGTTSYDTNAAALAAILNEWASAADYATRVAHLKGTLAGGLNGTSKLTNTSVSNDTASDTLTGGGGLDWFFAKLANPYADVVSDLGGGETVN